MLDIDASGRLRYFDALTKRPDMMNWTGVYTGYKTIQSEDDKTCDCVGEGRLGKRYDTVCAHGTPGRRALAGSGLTTLHRHLNLRQNLLLLPPSHFYPLQPSCFHIHHFTHTPSVNCRHLLLCLSLQCNQRPDLTYVLQRREGNETFASPLLQHPSHEAFRRPN